MNLPKTYIDERTGIEYTLVGDVYLPFYSENEDEEKIYIGLWGRGCPVDISATGRSADRGGSRDRRHRDYLKEYKPTVYRELLFSGKLTTYLADIDKQAEEMYHLLTRQMAQAEHITEQLKAEDPMAWVGAMNNISARVREIVYSKVIFQ